MIGNKINLETDQDVVASSEWVLEDCLWTMSNFN